MSRARGGQQPARRGPRVATGAQASPRKRWSRRTVLAAGVGGALIVLAVVLALVLSGGKRSGAPPATPAGYAALWASTKAGAKVGAVLAQWPKPYETYTSSGKQCYEWWDKPLHLYNLCFKDGVLAGKYIA